MPKSISDGFWRRVHVRGHVTSEAFGGHQQAIERMRLIARFYLSLVTTFENEPNYFLLPIRRAMSKPHFVHVIAP